MFVVTGQQYTCDHITLKPNYHLAKSFAIGCTKSCPLSFPVQLLTNISSAWRCFHLNVYEVRPRDYTHQSRFVLCCCVLTVRKFYSHRSMTVCILSGAYWNPGVWYKEYTFKHIWDICKHDMIADAMGFCGGQGILHTSYGRDHWPTANAPRLFQLTWRPQRAFQYEIAGVSQSWIY